MCLVVVLEPQHLALSLRLSTLVPPSLWCSVGGVPASLVSPAVSTL